MREKSFGGAAFLWAYRVPDSRDVVATERRVKMSGQSIRVVSRLFYQPGVRITSLNVRVLFGKTGEGSGVAVWPAWVQSPGLLSLLLPGLGQESEPQFS